MEYRKIDLADFIVGLTMEVLACLLIVCAIILKFIYAYDTMKSHQKYNKHPNYQLVCDLESYCSNEIHKSNRPSHPIKHNDEYMKALKNARLSLDTLKRFW